MGSDSSNQSNNYINLILEHYKNYNYNDIKFKVDCNVHKNEGMNEFIYKINANIFNSNPPEFIFIVDKSGSMGDNYNFIISKTIPEVLNSLGYQNRNIQLITFESSTNYLSISQSELSKSNDRCDGQTYMSNCYKLLDKIFEISKEKCKHLRILVITDGELHDQGDSQRNGEYLYEKYKNLFVINAQCIRLKTGGNPETRGIMPILKLNNVKHCHLVEHSSNDMNYLAKVIIPLFMDDGLIWNGIIIKGNKVNLKNNPWEENCSNALPLQNGNYTFFGDIKETLNIECNKINNPIECKNGEDVNTDNFNIIIGKEKLDDIFQRLKMNKVLNTIDSNKENSLITNYFKNLSIKTKKGNNNDNILQYLNEEINYINNDNTIYYLNNDQKADYIQNLSNLNRILELKELKKENKNMKEEIEKMKNEIKDIKKKLEKLGKLEDKINNIEEKNKKLLKEKEEKDEKEKEEKDGKEGKEEKVEEKEEKEEKDEKEKEKKEEKEINEKIAIKKI